MMATIGYGLGMTRAGAMWFALQCFEVIGESGEARRRGPSRSTGVLEPADMARWAAEPDEDELT